MSPKPEYRYMTILFKEDWKKYPRAIIHYSTTNTSFVELANAYHAMGIENCAFMLALTQPELEHVDPHDPDLSFEMQQRVIAECRINFWYFIREFVRVPIPGSLEAIKFRADRANIALYWMFFNHITTLITIIRQTGKTTMLMCLAAWLLNIGSMNSYINLLTKNDTLRTETLAKLKSLFEEFPDYGNFKSKLDVFNSEEANVSEWKNKFKGNLSSASPKQAEKVGRGLTSPINLIDEVAFIENIAIAMGAMLMAGNAARRFAREKGAPYGTVLATTAGDIDDRDGSYIYGLVNNSTRMSEHFFDAVNEDDLNNKVTMNSRSRENATARALVLIDYSHRQLGYDDAWLQKVISENISTPENLKRDMFGIWLSGSSTSPLPKHLIELMKRYEIENPHQWLYAPHNVLLWLMIPLEEIEKMDQYGIALVAGVDTSDGVGRDDIAMVVRNHVTGEVVMGALFNEINLITVADFFSSFLLKFKNSVMIMERKSSAPTIIDHMSTKLTNAGENIFKRMYNTIIQDKEKYPEEYKNVISGKVLYNESMMAKYKQHIGFKTSGSGITARSELYSTTLMLMLKYTANVTRWKVLVTQISQLVQRNNRIDHPKGGSDDAVIASLLSFWILINGKHLNDYGIDASRILKSNEVYLVDKYHAYEDSLDKERLQELEDEFNNLIVRIKAERDPIIQQKLEIRIKLLANDLGTQSNVVSVEELLEDVRRQRRVRRW